MQSPDSRTETTNAHTISKQRRRVIVLACAALAALGLCVLVLVVFGVVRLFRNVNGDTLNQRLTRPYKWQSEKPVVSDEPPRTPENASVSGFDKPRSAFSTELPADDSYPLASRLIVLSDEAIIRSPDGSSETAAYGWTYRCRGLKDGKVLVNGSTFDGFVDASEVLRIDAASDKLATLLKRNPKEARYHFALAACLLHAHVPQAIESFSQAIALDPGLARAYAGRGSAYAALGEEASASKDFGRATMLDPDSPHIWIEWGNSLRKGRKYEVALEKIKRALEIQPANGRGRAVEASIYLGQGLNNASLAAAERGLGINPTDDWLHSLRGAAIVNAVKRELEVPGARLTLTMIERLKSADQSLAEAGKLNGANSVALYNRSACLATMSQSDPMMPFHAIVCAFQSLHANWRNGRALKQLEDLNPQEIDVVGIRKLNDLGRLFPDKALGEARLALFTCNLKEVRQGMEEIAKLDVPMREECRTAVQRVAMCFSLEPETGRLHDERGRSALCVFIGRNHDALAWLLMNAADPNVRNRDGSTPLHVAAALADTESLLQLVNLGANLDARKPAGATAFDVALRAENFLGAAILLKAGASFDPAETPGSTVGIADGATRKGFESALAQKAYDTLLHFANESTRRAATARRNANLVARTWLPPPVNGLGGVHPLERVQVETTRFDAYYRDWQDARTEALKTAAAAEKACLGECDAVVWTAFFALPDDKANELKAHVKRIAERLNAKNR